MRNINKFKITLASLVGALSLTTCSIPKTDPPELYSQRPTSTHHTFSIGKTVDSYLIDFGNDERYNINFQTYEIIKNKLDSESQTILTRLVIGDISQDYISALFAPFRSIVTTLNTHYNPNQSTQEITAFPDLLGLSAKDKQNIKSRALEMAEILNTPSSLSSL